MWWWQIFWDKINEVSIGYKAGCATQKAKSIFTMIKVSFTKTRPSTPRFNGIEMTDTLDLETLSLIDSFSYYIFNVRDKVIKHLLKLPCEF